MFDALRVTHRFDNVCPECICMEWIEQRALSFCVMVYICFLSPLVLCRRGHVRAVNLVGGKWSYTAGFANR